MESRINKSKVFKDAANYKLKGTTFDAKHLDRLITYGVSGSEARQKMVASPRQNKDNYKAKIELRKEKYDNMR